MSIKSGRQRGVKIIRISENIIHFTRPRVNKLKRRFQLFRSDSCVHNERRNQIIVTIIIRVQVSQTRFIIDILL